MPDAGDPGTDRLIVGKGEGMETRSIGSLAASVIGLGCNNFGRRITEEAQVRSIVDAAIDAGITFFDTADIYGGTKSEELLGRTLGSRRDDVLIATKFGMPVDEERKGAKPEYVRRASEDSLRRLGTDRIDLYQLHEPDPDTPIADTLGALDELVRAGKVREIGCSNFSVEQLREAEAAAGEGAARFVSVQNEYNLFVREPEEDGVLAESVRQGLAFIPYSPLESGVLTGKYRTGEAPPEGTRLSWFEADEVKDLLADDHLSAVDRLSAWASDHGHSATELALAWLLAQRPVASVIAGATSPDQVRANTAAAGWTLDDEDLAQVERALAGD
jgi:aryl-alcohol dehydrogenase-like predicted oxidoreductase